MKKSNIDIVKNYIAGIRPLTQFGYTGKVYAKRAVGEKWTDSKGQQWEQKASGPVTVSRIGEIVRAAINQKCKCGQIVKWGSKLDAIFFRKTGLCFSCLVDYETKLRLVGVYPDYERYKILSNEIGHLREMLDKVKETIKYFTEGSGDVEMLCNSEGFIERWKTTNKEQIVQNAKRDLKKLRQEISMLAKMKVEAKRCYIEGAKKYQLEIYGK